MIPSAVFSISAVQAFVQVSELRSFRRAAVALGVTPAAVSKAIAALEEQAGVSLLDRTSRGVALTDPGARLLPHCKQALEALTSGEAALHEATTRVRGALRVSLPFVLGPLLVQALPRFLDRFPEVTFDLRFTDRFVWLLEEDVDLALRIGELPDSSLRAKRLGRLDWVTIASADYLRRHGTPERPRALLEHRCLKFRAPSGLAVEWVFATTASDGQVELRDLPAEFVEWVLPRWADDPEVPSYLCDLARHELLDLDVRNDWRGGEEPTGLPLALDRPLRFDGAVRMVEYDHAVQRLTKAVDDRTVPDAEPTRLLVYRDAEHRPRYLLLTPFAYALCRALVLDGLAVQPGLMAACETLGEPLDDDKLASAATLFADLMDRGVCLGAEPD